MVWKTNKEYIFDSTTNQLFFAITYIFQLQKTLLDKDLILEMFSDNKHIAVTRFREYNQTLNNDICLEDKERVRLTDEEAGREIEKILPVLEWVQAKTMPKAERDHIINKMKAIDGITQRQLARILGISPGLVFKACKKKR